jgi:hypothetical protein
MKRKRESSSRIVAFQVRAGRWIICKNAKVSFIRVIILEAVVKLKYLEKKITELKCIHENIQSV